MFCLLSAAALNGCVAQQADLKQTEKNLQQRIKQSNDELAQTRRRGYAVNRHESEIGVVSIAAPIRDATTRCVAAISVAGPAERLEPHEFQVAQVTIEVAAAVSRRLGHRGSYGVA